MQSSPVSIMFLSFSPPPQNLDCVLVIPLLHKRTFVTRVQGLPSFAYHILEPYRLSLWTTPPNFLSWLITSFLVPSPHSPHNPPRLSLMSLALLIFSLCFHLPAISAQSIGHCPICILGVMLIEGQFTALLNNSQWHFNAVLELVVEQIRQTISKHVLNPIYLFPEGASLRSKL